MPLYQKAAPMGLSPEFMLLNLQGFGILGGLTHLHLHSCHDWESWHEVGRTKFIMVFHGYTANWR